MFLAVLMLMTALILSSCGEVEKADSFSDTLLLTDMKVGDASVPAFFNPATGSMTPICTDPLCDHTYTSGCPFAGYNTVWEPHYYNGSIYFLSMQTFGKPDDFAVMRYDMDSAEVTELIDMKKLEKYIPDDVHESGGQSFGFNGSYFRYTIRGEDRTPKFMLRVALDDGKVEILSTEYRQPFAQYKKQFLAYTPELDYTAVSCGIMLTDKNGKLIKTILPEKRISIAFDDLLDEGKLIYVTAFQKENGKYDRDRMTVYMYDMDTEEDRVIIENFPSSYIACVGDYIYYSKYVDDLPMIGYDLNNNAEQFNTSGGILYRLNINTGEESIAFELPEYCLNSTNIDRVGQYIIIGYQNTDYDNYEEEATSRSIWCDYAKESGRIVYDTVSETTAIYKEAST